MKVLIDYCGVVAKHIADRKLGSMKSHEWHVMMQQLLPLALRGLMDEHVRLCLMQVS